ncbi:thiamine pyrophosphate-binding protein [Brevibacillus laterosporus]|uniref:thiamine pyrophosphate-binding protein n=1 Tax=Brevibacillus laterosporus TaxID=1465 RepID=UPI000364BBD1|nr:thiamine pyrophosphate-binding protein [Brevibacillus laterosporus]ATO49918.1 acetolactate synthase [Brevibacillus laterosporus DSM 25]MBG9802761.1 acetolactate synthase [Brevibacillus laterosporus]MED2006376.1 thiamine pyrophosphate-binding protein [Brevibacillus laterosporus]MED4764667.1 thiamine pyrophosphate-binding protein [Brevibacillus laterosporus]TPH18345.1 thiamine pyrophosphate-binding protein [Brevibacillus laterosporus]
MEAIKSLTIWDAYASVLVEQGITKLFGMVGDGAGLIESAYKKEGLHIFTARDQRIAVGMAMGHAQVSGNPAVLVTSPGPGIANCIMGVLEAYSAAVPLIVISNATARNMRGEGAFQETNSIAMMQPVTKWCYRVEHPEKAIWALRRAVFVAVNGKPGPVYLEIPDDLTWEELGSGSFSADKKNLDEQGPIFSQPEEQSMRNVFNQLTKAKRPIILLGGGCQHRPFVSELTISLAEAHGLAIFTTASGRGIVDERHPYAFGNVGLYTLPQIKKLLFEADMIIAIGTQLEETALMGWKEALSNTCFVHIDCHYESLERSVHADYRLLGDAQLSLQNLWRMSCENMDCGTNSKNEWIKRMQEVKQEALSVWAEIEDIKAPVRSMLKGIEHEFGEHVVLVQDNGLHDMWGYSYPVYTVAPPSRTVVPGEQTALGLPMGISLGAKIADRKAHVIALLGDGSFEMGYSAVGSAVEHQLGITFIVINNGGFSWPRFQQSMSEMEIGCCFQIELNYAALAQSVGGYYKKLTTSNEYQEALKEARLYTEQNKIALLELVVNWDQDLPITVMMQYGDKEQ